MGTLSEIIVSASAIIASIVALVALVRSMISGKEIDVLETESDKTEAVISDILKRLSNIEAKK